MFHTIWHTLDMALEFFPIFRTPEPVIMIIFKEKKTVYHFRTPPNQFSQYSYEVTNIFQMTHFSIKESVRCLELPYYTNHVCFKNLYVIAAIYGLENLIANIFRSSNHIGLLKISKPVTPLDTL